MRMGYSKYELTVFPNFVISTNDGVEIEYPDFILNKNNEKIFKELNKGIRMKFKIPRERNIIKYLYKNYDNYDGEFIIKYFDATKYLPEKYLKQKIKKSILELDLNDLILNTTKSKNMNPDGFILKYTIMNKDFLMLLY